MAINVSAANSQAAQLNDNIAKLRSAKKQMQAYRASVSNNWQSKEVSYILNAIDQVIGDIDAWKKSDCISRAKAIIEEKIK